jgi:hypothetical protein
VCDFSSPMLGGVGPVVLRRHTCLGGSRPLASCGSAAECPGGQCIDLRAEADDPVPLDGLNAADTGYAFVVNESLLGEDRNGDGDITDDVVQLVDEHSGALLPIGDGAAGLAVVRLRQPPFTRPGLVASGDLVAFLEPEALQHDHDLNGDGDVFDTVLRVFRLQDATATDVTGADPLVADAAPLVGGQPVAISGGRVFFRTPEAALTRSTTAVVSLRQTGEPDTEPKLLQTTQTVSADGRFVVFSTYDPRALLPGPGGTVLLMGSRAVSTAFYVSGEPILPGYEWVLARFDAATGLLDPSFGSGGAVSLSFGGFDDTPRALTQLPDGRIVGAGYHDTDGGYSSAGRSFALARYRPDGRPDPTFGGQCAWESRPLIRPPG